MKYLLLSIVRSWGKFLLGILSLTGILTNCDSSRPLSMYGSPYARYKISGKITSESSGNPIANILLRVKDNQYTIDSIYTDAAGNYVSNLTSFPNNKQWTLMATDEDGIVNGSFYEKDSLLNIPLSSLTGGDQEWYSGKAEVEVNLKLKSK